VKKFNGLGFLKMSFLHLIWKAHRLKF